MLVLGINLSFALHNQSVVAGGTLKGENCTQYIYWVCKSRYCVFDVRMHWKFVDNPWCVIPIYEGVIAYLRIFLLQPVRLRSRLQHKCKKKGLDSALCFEIYAVNLYFNAYWLFVCVARYLCISSLVIFILFWVQDSAHLLLIWLPSSQSPADNFYHGGAHLLIGRVIVCPNYSHALSLQVGWRQWS